MRIATATEPGAHYPAATGTSVRIVRSFQIFWNSLALGSAAPPRTDQVLRWAWPILTNGNRQGIKQESESILPVWLQTHIAVTIVTLTVFSPPTDTTNTVLAPPPQNSSTLLAAAARRAGGRHTL